MEQVVDIVFKISLKEIKRTLALIGADIPSDEELMSKFDGHEIDLNTYPEEDVRDAKLGITMLSISSALK